jgi:hypothetical protein
MADLKQKQKFEQNWQRFQTITGSTNPAQVTKIPLGSVAAHFQTVIAQRLEKAEKEFQIKLTGIIEAKVALDKDLKKGKEDLSKREEQEYEKLNKAIGDAFSMLEQVQKQGQNMLNQAAGNFEKEEEETDDSTSTEENEERYKA